jgi:death on curing protein
MVSSSKILAILKYPLNKAAAIFESIIFESSIVHGNKTTAYVLLRLFLKEYKLDIEATKDEKFDFVLRLHREN